MDRFGLPCIQVNVKMESRWRNVVLPIQPRNGSQRRDRVARSRLSGERCARTDGDCKLPCYVSSSRKWPNGFPKRANDRIPGRWQNPAFECTEYDTLPLPAWLGLQLNRSWVSLCRPGRPALLSLPLPRSTGRSFVAFALRPYTESRKLLNLPLDVTVVTLSAFPYIPP